MADTNDKTDPEILRFLANWFDAKYPGGNTEVQDDLRRIADKLDYLEGNKVNATR